MTKIFKIAIVSLAVIAGASSVQAGSTSENFSADAYWAELERTGA